ncbi:MAG: hypothetical protein ACRDT6_02960 [Micromonosporaceae bacterium]
MAQAPQGWLPAVTGIVYAVQFDQRPIDAVDRLLELIVATDVLPGSPERYAAAIPAALASSDRLADLVPQPHSEGAIRQLLDALGKRLRAWLKRPPRYDVRPVDEWRPQRQAELVAHLKREPDRLSRWLGLSFSDVAGGAPARVAVLKLSSGYAVALIQLVGNAAPGTTLFQADQRPAGEVLAEFLADTGLPEAIVDWTYNDGDTG